jgi:hypothetical protein
MQTEMRRAFRGEGVWWRNMTGIDFCKLRCYSVYTMYTNQNSQSSIARHTMPVVFLYVDQITVVLLPSLEFFDRLPRMDGCTK